MVLKCIKVQGTKDDYYLYIQKSTYLAGKVSSVNVMKCGRLSELKKSYDDPIAHFTELARVMTQEEEEAKRDQIISIDFCPSSLISPTQSGSLFAGHLFLNPIYKALELPEFCKAISKKYKFKFDLNSILNFLVNSTFINPTSKLASYEEKERYVDNPDFSLEQIYRGLEYIAQHNEELQAHLYKASKSIIKRDTSILYYDCTNYFFEIDDEDPEKIDPETGDITKGKRSYGHCKRNSKLPITQVGLFMDSNGIPLAFTTFPGACSEQTTLRPLEKRILKDFGMSEFIVCTDAGLTSYSNKKFNTGGKRAFVTTQSLKLLSRNARKDEKSQDGSQIKMTDKQKIVAWALDKTGWFYRTYDQATQSWIIHDNIDLSTIKEEDWETIFFKTIFYKDRIFKYQCEITDENGKKSTVILEERFVVSYCYKYKLRPQRSREREINRIRKLLRSPKAILKEKFGRGARFIKEECFNEEGEIISDKVATIDEEYVANEAKYDGFYCVTTNLFSEQYGDAYKIVQINSRRWEIEECFLIMSQLFKTRPIYLQREDRINAHLTVKFLSLLIYRILESKVNEGNEQYTYWDIVETIRDITLAPAKGKGFIPAFKRTKLVDRISEITKIELRNEILTHKMVSEQIAKSKR